MASIDGSNFAKSYSSSPTDRSQNVGDYGGSIKCEIDSSASGLAADTLNLGKLPKNAKVISVSSVGAGTGAAYNVAPHDVMSAETVIILTVGTSPTLPIKSIVQYVVV